ncbi:MAG: hypothetical protein FWE35_07705 [Streptosporangiales bacterium]|nr:hypothetical protein [Streptosporangiales bacterium]
MTSTEADSPRPLGLLTRERYPEIVGATYSSAARRNRGDDDFTVNITVPYAGENRNRVLLEEWRRISGSSNLTGTRLLRDRVK